MKERERERNMGPDEFDVLALTDGTEDAVRSLLSRYAAEKKRVRVVADPSALPPPDRLPRRFCFAGSVPPWAWAWAPTPAS